MQMLNGKIGDDDNCDTCEPSACYSVRFSIFFIRDERMLHCCATAVATVAFCLCALAAGTLALLTFLQVPLSLKPKSERIEKLKEI